MYIGLHVKYPLFLSDCNETWNENWQIFEKYWSIKFHENLCSGSLVVLCGWMGGQTDRQTDMTKLIVAFSNLMNSPKNEPTVQGMMVSFCTVCSCAWYTLSVSLW